MSRLTGLALSLSLLVVAFAVSPIAAHAAIASLGDSYSSGEGAGPFDSGTNVIKGNNCHRSSKAWTRLIGVPKANHFACSGAKTFDFYNPGREATSQLDRLRALVGREPVSKVYVTVGGNDLGFARIVRDCVTHSCLKRSEEVELPELRDRVRPAVTTALVDTHAAAPAAQVILVGYPDIIPARGSEFRGCGWLENAEKPRLWQLEDSLDTALSQAAAAGATYVSIRGALRHHELCTPDSWVFPVAGVDNLGSVQLIGNQQQGHPDAEGQQAIYRAVLSAERAGAGAVPPPPAGCVPASNIESIVDDSGSMRENDALNIRGAAMQLLITKPTGLGRTLGAIEFGEEAGSLFDPAAVSGAQQQMLTSLGGLQNDGYFDGGGSTDYNAAFAEAAASNPGAQARIFLTDGGHNFGPFADGHLGGPRTYVIGLNIGPAGEGEESAELLGRIAGDTGGAYFPLLRSPGDSAEVQARRLQPVFAAIDSLIDCRQAPQQSVRNLKKVGAPARPVVSRFGGAAGLEIVATWTTPGTQVSLAHASALNAGGRVVANLTGKAIHRARGRRAGKNSHPQALGVSTVQGSTFETITITRPKHGSTLTIALSAAALAAPTAVNIQVSPVATLPTPPAAQGSAPAAQITPVESAPAPPSPPPAANHMEQATPKHPVNTFSVYHNASGVGPQIAAGQWVEVSCRVYDPTIASVNPDGYWYRIASSPWNNGYYAAANTFMNGDPVGGPYTHNTDFAVPVC